MSDREVTCECCGHSGDGPYAETVVFERDYTEHTAASIKVRLCVYCAAEEGDLFPRHLNGNVTDRATWRVTR